ncbi:WXG100 family type VII secretion target [Paenibacillus sp. ACRSA]|uniref:WXG100 family type VII secretion target n=1 Tax=Paenibacillus sp. ACRSA TaxID=2918211 RepID=UPI001EF4F467|nr:WXG100 family type VII secretion target [Paenibacillus sp. ACRSA]MCG7378112.1 WXG100 family type VII secretion target [Paenibacillus sp. ACRSA]
MNTIKVTPEQLHYVSNQVDQARQQLESIRGELTRQIMFIRMMWTGATQEQFYYEFERSSSTLDRALERMVQTSKELKDIATRFEDADAQKVNLGGTAGAVGVAAMMTNSSGTTSDDKGYRMAQVNMYGRLVWMPVNENGVTDQASLQAYQKDQGHLDFNQMQAVNVEPPGEDIYALQIKAFELGIHPFSGEPVSENYAQLMVASLKVSQIFMGIQMVRGSIPGGKGKYRLPSNSKVVMDMKKNIEAAKAKRENRLKKPSAGVTDEAEGTRLGKYITDPVKMRKYIIPPEDGFQAFIERKYIDIRKIGLDDVETVSKNTGLTQTEVSAMKKHLFLTVHDLSVEGKPYKKLYMQGDQDIAFGWQQAQVRELTKAEKDWFRQTANHELKESDIMEFGVRNSKGEIISDPLPLRDKSTWDSDNKTFKVVPSKNAHDKADETDPNPRPFPEYDPGNDVRKHLFDDPDKY